MTDPRAQALALEQGGDLSAALAAYEHALATTPDDAELLADLGRLAGRMGMHAVAEAFYARLLIREPERLEAVDGLTRALRDQHRYAEAVAIMSPAIEARPADARLWNTLGTVLHQQGDSRLASTFFEEATRLDPTLATARYNLGGARMDLGELAAARADFDAASPLASTPHERAMIDFARATVRLAQGDLGEGWDAYEARLSPDMLTPTAFDLPGERRPGEHRPRERWTPDTPLNGRRLLVVAEQGLGDEVMFANLLPDVVAALGQTGHLALAVEPRLVTLFRRSFPTAEVTAHATRREADRAVRSAPDATSAELWAPLASLPRRFRRSPLDFPRRPYLVADPARVTRWRNVLQAQDATLPWVGLTWRSGSLGGERRRHYPALEDWAPVLRTPEMRFVNLQYGADPAELETLEQVAGAPILRPPDIDLKADLDELAALACALELVIAVPNATAALAAACGAQTWFVGGPSAWPRLGTGGYPWYAHTRSFAAEAFGAFAPPLARVAETLKGRVGGGST